MAIIVAITNNYLKSLGTAPETIALWEASTSPNKNTQDIAEPL